MSTFVITPTDEQEKIVTAFLEALNISFVSDKNDILPPHVLKGIARGQEDFKAGRTMSFDEFKSRMRSVK